MIDDRNKTELTKQVTIAAIDYFDGNGCKPVETEVVVGPGWTADIATVLCPTQTELIGLKLLPKRPPWGSDLMADWKENRDSLHRVMTVICEVKTSRGDFVGDKKWGLTPPSDLAYVAISENLKQFALDLPVIWGILVFGDNSIRLARPPKVWAASVEQQRDLILQVAIRRDHRTRYEALRTMRRRELDYRNENKSLTRMSTALAITEYVVTGKGSPEEAGTRFGVKLPDYCIERLRKLAPAKDADSVGAAWQHAGR